jgi:hypothetical protein
LFVCRRKHATTKAICRPGPVCVLSQSSRVSFPVEVVGLPLKAV